MHRWQRRRFDEGQRFDRSRCPGSSEKGDDRSVGMADKVDGTAAQLRDVGGVSAEVLSAGRRPGVVAAAVRSHQSPSGDFAAQIRPGGMRPGDRAMYEDDLRATSPPADDQAGVRRPRMPALSRRPLASCDHCASPPCAASSWPEPAGAAASAAAPTLPADGGCADMAILPSGAGSSAIALRYFDQVIWSSDRPSASFCFSLAVHRFGRAP